ncbi:MAG: M20/M25/M40 family metallo-hydrolase [Chloroflexi bacterium]|nr:M20/M25/M40 family metallo-hydrolase [Chloroflexota bacterium]
MASTPDHLSLTPLVAPQATYTSTPTPNVGQTLLDRVASVSTDQLMSTVDSLAAIPSRHVNSPTVGDAAEWLRDELRSYGGRLVITEQPFPLVWGGIDTFQRNIIATLPGDDPSAGSLVVGAHYDSRTVDVFNATSLAPGANDNASGSAAVLEMARLLADQTPQRTIHFALFSAEEVTLDGSRFFVSQAQQQGETIIAMIALDTIGNAAGDTGGAAVRVFAAPPDLAVNPADSPGRLLGRSLAATADLSDSPLDVQLQPTLDRPGRWSDHVPFVDAGIPALRLIEPIERTDLNHSGFDLPETISPIYLTQVTRLTLNSLIGLAWGPQPPILQWSETGLSWEMVPSSQPALVILHRNGGLEFDIQQLDAGQNRVQVADVGDYEGLNIALIWNGQWIGLLSETIDLRQQP